MRSRKLAADRCVHGVDVSLKDDHALPCKIGGVVDWELAYVWVARPIVLQDEKEILCLSDGRDRKESAAATMENAGDALGQSGFTLLKRRMCADAEGRFSDKAVDMHASRDCCRNEMAVVFPGVVASEEGVESGNLDQVHARSQDVTRRIWRDADAVLRVCGVEGDGLNHWKGRVYILLVIELTDIAVGP